MFLKHYQAQRDVQTLEAFNFNISYLLFVLAEGESSDGLKGYGGKLSQKRTLI